MLFITHFLLGYIVSFIGSIPPASINLTAIQISLNKGVKQALLFSLGATVVEIFYSYIAIKFSNYIVSNNDLDLLIQLIAIPVFLVLGIVTLMTKSVKQEESTELQKTKRSDFMNGFILGLINPLQIPFWIAYSSYFFSTGWLINDTVMIYTFIVGITLGTISLLAVLAVYSKKIAQKFKMNTAFINKIIGWVFIALALFQAASTLFSYLKSNGVA